MARTPDTDRLDSVIGQMLAIRSVVVALIESHPQPDRLAEEIEGATQTQLAVLENDRRAADRTIKGFQSALAFLRGDRTDPHQPE